MLGLKYIHVSTMGTCWYSWQRYMGFYTYTFTWPIIYFQFPWKAIGSHLTWIIYIYTYTSYALAMCTLHQMHRKYNPNNDIFRKIYIYLKRDPSGLGLTRVHEFLHTYSHVIYHWFEIWSKAIGFDSTQIYANYTWIKEYTICLSHVHHIRYIIKK